METLHAHNRNGVRKAKAHLEFKVEKELEYNRKGFLHKYAGSKREAKENVSSLFSEIRDPGTKERGCTRCLLCFNFQR